MTAIQRKPDNQVAHLSAHDVEQLGRSLDRIRESSGISSTRFWAWVR